MKECRQSNFINADQVFSKTDKFLQHLSYLWLKL